jgi:sugar O-acyltransferase (sialic acid O-acetyltransferase NeuD family)
MPRILSPSVECVLYGVGSPFVEEVLEALLRLGWTVRGGVANIETDYRPARLTPIVGRGEIPPDWLALPVLLPLVTPGHRWGVEREVLEVGFRSFATVVDPTAIVASTAAIGEGAVVVAGALLGAEATIGRLTCVNKAANVGHHVALSDYAALGPGCVLCGYVTVGRGAFIGAGAVVNPKVSMGANAVVGSGSVVRHDVPEHTLVVGNPAVVVREVAGYNDVSVGDRRTSDS